MARQRQASVEILSEPQCAALMTDTVGGPPFLGWDRRNNDRWDKRQVVHLFAGNGRKASRFLVRARDLGRHGIGLFHSVEIARGTPVRVAMLTIKGRRVERTGCVASCIRRPDGIFAVGIRFDQSVAADEFIPRRVTRAA